MASMVDDDEATAAHPAEEEEAAAGGEEEEEEEESEEVSDAEKLAIVQHFLLNAPPGQFEEVKRDALALVPEGLVSPAMMAGICRAYNTAQLRVARTASGDKVMVCGEAEVDPTRYRDPENSGATYAVDHVALTAVHQQEEEEEGTDDADDTSSSERDASRAAVAKALAEYVSSRYRQDERAASAVYLLDDASSETALKLVVSGEAVNLRNYWSGNWRSTWTVGGLGSGAVSVSGELKVRAHYFEDGNVQLQTAKTIPSTPLGPNASESPAALAKAVVAFVSDAETALQSGLEDMYSNMSHETFKAMRRTMPITRTKMKWNIHEIALNRNLRK